MKNRKSRRQKNSQKKRVKKIPVLEAKSGNTGIVHFFGNPEEWTNVMATFEQKSLTKQKTELITALSFDSFLKSKQIQSIPDVRMASPVFRIVAPAFDVWSVAGSLADGGRFNIGGAQLNSNLAHLHKYAALYVASDLECALAEVAKPLGKVKAYRLHPKKELILWDLNKVISELDHPNLLHLINSTPTDAIWGYQKIPLCSQILAFHLRSLGGNGIIFPSTKLTQKSNIALFFSSDADSQSAFDVEEVSIP